MKSIRRLSVCHIRREWDTQHAHWSETWCGKRGFLEHDFKSTPKDDARVNAQIERQNARPQMHCPRCVKYRQAAEPDWKPKDMSPGKGAQ